MPDRRTMGRLTPTLPPRIPSNHLAVLPLRALTALFCATAPPLPYCAFTTHPTPPSCTPRRCLAPPVVPPCPSAPPSCVPVMPSRPSGPFALVLPPGALARRSTRHFVLWGPYGAGGTPSCHPTRCIAARTPRHCTAHPSNGAGGAPPHPPLPVDLCCMGPSNGAGSMPTRRPTRHIAACAPHRCTAHLSIGIGCVGTVSLHWQGP
ncbi:hypothetical protein DENSPDRAFT_885836 [Dentipellis sp. KUC8613]|nr:hypothetical protein DENSPDRAFT_885836 [Dentipellis sp. KUC8613]